jgi:hypothetical protein
VSERLDRRDVPHQAVNEYPLGNSLVTFWPPGETESGPAGRNPTRDRPDDGAAEGPAALEDVQRPQQVRQPGHPVVRELLRHPANEEVPCLLG